MGLMTFYLSRMSRNPFLYQQGILSPPVLSSCQTLGHDSVGDIFGLMPKSRGVS